MTPLPAEDIGIERFKRIAGEAEKYNINLAIENQGNPEYIDYIFVLTAAMKIIIRQILICLIYMEIS